MDEKKEEKAGDIFVVERGFLVIGLVGVFDYLWNMRIKN